MTSTRGSRINIRPTWLVVRMAVERGELQLQSGLVAVRIWCVCVCDWISNATGGHEDDVFLLGSSFLLGAVFKEKPKGESSIWASEKDAYDVLPCFLVRWDPFHCTLVVQPLEPGFVSRARILSLVWSKPL